MNDIRKLVIVCAICFVFMVAEIVGGILSRSLALLSDAAHLFSDIAGFFISLVALLLTRKPATKSLSYGFHRAEVIGAIFSVSLIWALTAFLVMEAVDRVKNPEPIDGQMMFFLALCGLIVNLAMAGTLHPHHSHAERGAEAGELKERHHTGKTTNLNMRSAFIHVVGDAIQSVGVLIASIIIWMKPTWTIADPLCTFLFSILVLVTTCRLLKEVVHVLMEGTPAHIDPTSIVNDLTKVAGVVYVHDMHVWCLSPDKLSITFHIVVDSHRDGQTDGESPTNVYRHVLGECQRIICEKYGIHHSTIQVELAEDQTTHCVSAICARDGDRRGANTSVYT